MPWFIKLRRLCREERAGVAMVTAVMLTALVALVGTAVDLGVLFTAKAQLQNAADAAALAAADTLIVYDELNQAVAQPDTAVSTARELSLANNALGTSLNLLGQDITLGFWDNNIGDFDPSRTGASSNPDDLTGVRVKVRRDDLANSPVTTFFAGVVGVSEVGVSATATAFLGYAGSVEEGTVDLPIAVDEAALNNGNGPLCGNSIQFHDENNENGSWTSFFEWPTNDPTVRRYVCGCEESPPLKVGDMINLINGNLSNNTFQSLYNRFQSEGTDTNGDGQADEWLVVLPVYRNGANSGAAELVGFAHMVITGVQLAPDKMVTGYLQCGMMIPNSQTGGIDFGSRATYAKLIR